MDTGVVGLFLIDWQWLARHFDFDSHMGKIESQTAMRTQINYALKMMSEALMMKMEIQSDLVNPCSFNPNNPNTLAGNLGYQAVRINEVWLYMNVGGTGIVLPVCHPSVRVKGAHQSLLGCDHWWRPPGSRWRQTCWTCTETHLGRSEVLPVVVPLWAVGHIR